LLRGYNEPSRPQFRCCRICSLFFATEQRRQDHPYRSVVDRVEILYECGRYGVTFKKLITPLGPEKVRSVFAKIGVSVFPDDPELTQRRSTTLGIRSN
jgi:hypothetical protein